MPAIDFILGGFLFAVMMAAHPFAVIAVRRVHLEGQSAAHRRMPGDARSILDLTDGLTPRPVFDVVTAA
jgi:hypothetical protein